VRPEKNPPMTTKKQAASSMNVHTKASPHTNAHRLRTGKSCKGVLGGPAPRCDHHSFRRQAYRCSKLSDFWQYLPVAWPRFKSSDIGESLPDLSSERFRSAWYGEDRPNLNNGHVRQVRRLLS